MSSVPAKGNHSTPSPVATELLVTGMTCSNCVRHVTEAIQSVAGVQSVLVARETNRATARWESGRSADVEALLSAVKAAGFAATAIEPGRHDQGEKRPAGWQANLWLGAGVTLPLMLGEWVFNLGLAAWFQWISFLLAALVQIFAGAQFYRGAWRQLKAGSSNMDTLVALGSTTAFGYSAWALLSGQGGHLYFMEAAAIITLISVGHWFEARVSARASAALRSLLQLAPPTARRLATPAAPPANAKFDLRSFSVAPTTQSTEVEVPVAKLQANDLVALRPGDRVPVDGIVTEGASAVDEAMLTGEATPVDKSVGKELYAGTVNLNGRLVLRVTATGEGTALAHIIAAVQRAQSSRANIQRLGDRVSNVFVPIVVLIALAAGIFWGAAPEAANRLHTALGQFLWAAHPPAGVAAGFIIAAAVLIIACPCAMGLATPAAIMASANAAAARGILIRDGVALEKAGTVTAVVFDKTGTLTVGRPEVVQIAGPLATASSPLDGGRLAQERMKGIAAALARGSSHPLSQALAKISPEEIRFSEWRELRGAGLEGRFNEVSTVKTARLGGLPWLREAGVNLAGSEAFVAEAAAQGATIVGFALDHALVGLFALRDTLKPGAAKVVTQLRQTQLKAFLLTGDNVLTAESIARQVGIARENVFAEVRPEQKAEFVKQLQARGERVAFVGDGINDAPALTQADLGIAVSRASDVAREAADIILLKSEIEAVPEALGLARATLRTIKQNLFWAFFYNAVGVPLAALGFMSPVLCAAAMGFSDLIVIGNALRLRRWRQSSPSSIS